MHDVLVCEDDAHALTNGECDGHRTPLVIRCQSQSMRGELNDHSLYPSATVLFSKNSCNNISYRKKICRASQMLIFPFSIQQIIEGLAMIFS